MPRQGPPPRPRQSQAPRVNPRPLQGWQQQGLARATAAGNQAGYLANHPGVMSNQVLTARQGGMPTYAPPRQLPRPPTMRGKVPPQIGGNMGPQQPPQQPQMGGYGSPGGAMPQPPQGGGYPQEPRMGSDSMQQGGYGGMGGGYGVMGGGGGYPQPRMGSDSIPGGGGYPGGPYSPGMQSILQNRGYGMPRPRNQPPQWAQFGPTPQPRPDANGRITSSGQMHDVYGNPMFGGGSKSGLGQQTDWSNMPGLPQGGY